MNILGRFWRWLREARWDQVDEEKIVGYDNPNPFGHQSPIYRFTGHRVWKRSFSRLGWLVFWVICLLFLIEFPLAFLWPDFYQQMLERLWGEVNEASISAIGAAVIAGLIILFLWLAAIDEVGEKSYYPPER